MQYQIIKNHKQVTKGSKLKCQIIRLFTGGVIYPILDINSQETKESVLEVFKNAKKVYSTGFYKESEDYDDGSPDLIGRKTIKEEIQDMFNNFQIADPGGYIVKNQGMGIERSISQNKVKVLESLHI